MVLQPTSGTAGAVTCTAGGLLHHLLTLTPHKRSGYFLLPYSSLTACFPLGNVVLFVVRTFLCLGSPNSDRASYCLAKIQKKHQFGARLVFLAYLFDNGVNKFIIILKSASLSLINC